MPFVILQDAREQDPWEFAHRTERANFAPPDTGDYSIKGLERILRIEKKRPDELWGCLGAKRDHFRDQLRRMTQFPIRLLIVEGSVADFAKKPRYSKLTWRMAAHNLTYWTTEVGVPVWFLGPKSPAAALLLENLMQGIYDLYQRDVDFLKHWRTLVPGVAA